MPETALLAVRLPLIRMVNAKRQSELAAESHICEKTIRNLEKGRANPTLKTLHCVADNFCMSVSAFLRLDLSQSAVEVLFEKYEGGDSVRIIPEILAISRWLNVF